MQFEDLSLYSYEIPHALPNVRNVGWLKKGTGYPTGDVPGLVNALKLWATRAAANRMRGYELCRFCPPAGYEQMRTSWNGENIWLGSSEIWIPDGCGGIFAAPNLIIHYVEAHRYLPPTQFIQAVMTPPPDDWDAETTAINLIRELFDRQGTTPDSRS